MLALAGCSASPGAVAGDASPPEVGAEAPTDAQPETGAAACGCGYDKDASDTFYGALVVSWECFCQGRDCSETLASESNCSGADFRIDYPACGLTVIGIPGYGGPYLHVFDTSGALVGEQESSDVGGYFCPTDPTYPFDGGASSLRAGRFPDANCAAVMCPTGYCGPCTQDASAD
jgi:hypothetical protein